MTGLIIKDIKLLSKQKKLAILYAATAIMLSFAMDETFITSYFSLVGSLLVLTTLSYDSYDNGYPFLMSLPINGKTYVYAKYVFSFMGLALFWIASILLQFPVMLIRGKEIIVSDVFFSNLAITPLFLIAIAIMIPISLKFGPDKSRIVMIIICFGGMGIGIAGKAVTDFLIREFSINIDISGFIAMLQSIPQNLLVLILLAIGIAIMLISAFISVGIMNNKEF